MILATLLLGASLSATPTPATATAGLRAQLAARREAQLDRLHEYAISGRFPRNTDTPSGPREYFIDPQGRLCAVANLLAADGHLDWVREIAAGRNQILVADLHDARVDEWIRGSGLLREELATIQKPAPGYPYSGGAGGDLVAQQDATELRARLLKVEADLRASTDASLDRAVTLAMTAAR